MKQLILILMAALMLIGCKAKQTVIKEETTTQVIDTTKTVTDTLGVVATHTDTTKTAKHVEQTATVEFVDGGGTVSIDTMGNVTIQGVKNITGKFKSDVLQVKGEANSTHISQNHSDQANGVTKNETQNRHTTEQVSRAIQWYEKPLIWIGSLCCIAAIIYAIFLYIHKKH